MPERAFFAVGDRVQLSGAKGRLHSLTLEPGKQFHTNKGAVAHDDIIGAPDGSVVVSAGGERFLALRPLLSDFVMAMPRGAAIVYPKDAAQILVEGDIFPGATVLEAGVGSGALTLWLLRGIGAEGTLHSFERRDEFADIAQANIESALRHDPPNWQLHRGDFVELAPAVVPAESVDRVVLDMLAPWECLETCVRVLAPGGVFVAYVATVTQLSRLAESIRASARFTEPVLSETLVRQWHADGLAVRPEHRMIGHTGFLLVARLLAEGTIAPETTRRKPKDGFDEADIEAWTPGAVGVREASDKSLRKTRRIAQAQAQVRQDSVD